MLLEYSLWMPNRATLCWAKPNNPMCPRQGVQVQQCQDNVVQYEHCRDFVQTVWPSQPTNWRWWLDRQIHTATFSSFGQTVVYNSAKPKSEFIQHVEAMLCFKMSSQINFCVDYKTCERLILLDHFITLYMPFYPSSVFLFYFFSSVISFIHHVKQWKCFVYIMY